jgi:hypothetical protein
MTMYSKVSDVYKYIYSNAVYFLSSVSTRWTTRFNKYMPSSVAQIFGYMLERSYYKYKCTRLSNIRHGWGMNFSE